MQPLFYIATIVSIWLILSEAAVITMPTGRLHKRQEQIAAVDAPSAALEAPLVVDKPPIEDTATPDTSAQGTSEEFIKGDATACGKKIQSEKPSDPAGEFLKCYMSGGL